MAWETIKRQLEDVLDAPLQVRTRPSFPAGELHVVDEGVGEVYFLLHRWEEGAEVLVADAKGLAPSEIQLIQLLLENVRQARAASDGQSEMMSDDEKNALLLNDWIHRCLSRGLEDEELPAMFATQPLLSTNMVPLLLYGQYWDSGQIDYEHLSKILSSFFEVDMLLIPLQTKEWLILCAESIISDESTAGESNDDDSREDRLTSLCLGLYEMIVNEGFSDCHLTVQGPIIPAQSLLKTVRILRETIAIGRAFNVGNPIHLPWELQLERLVYMLPHEEKKQLMRDIFKDENYELDAEMGQTLEQFFAVDGNLSETAKTLYIHRNTLTYRLDRFKQETGLDVRVFHDAVVARIGMLLYKMTKNN